MSALVCSVPAAVAQPTLSTANNGQVKTASAVTADKSSTAAGTTELSNTAVVATAGVMNVNDHGAKLPSFSNKPLMIKSGVVSGGLSVSLTQAGVPDSVALELVRELSQTFNVEEDISTDDRFTVLFEAPLIGNKGNQKLLAFEFTNQGKTYAAYWFDPLDGASKAGYYTRDGGSLKPAFLRTPIEVVRVTSGFGARKVPRRKQWRNHDGVDFGAPVGTPIYAAADGKVEVMRTERGFGKVIKLVHPKNIKTVYGHMSKFVKELSVGSTVKQGQVIGYVGRTGWATGPHLHYEYRVDNLPIDPFSNDFPAASALTDTELQQFTALVSVFDERLTVMKRISSMQLSSKPDNTVKPNSAQQSE